MDLVIKILIIIIIVIIFNFGQIFAAFDETLYWRQFGQCLFEKLVMLMYNLDEVVDVQKERTYVTLRCEPQVSSTQVVIIIYINMQLVEFQDQKTNYPVPQYNVVTHADISQ